MTLSPPHVYGRRRGHRLSTAKKIILRTLLPDLSISLDGVSNHTLDPYEFFSDDVENVSLEIGFGKGEHLAAQAGNHPLTGFIGCEPYVGGIAALLTHVKDHALSNIRIYPDDARHLLKTLTTSSIDRVFLLHPDPWPKHRHAKRRFINSENLDALSRVMRQGAELRISSDHPVMVAWTLAHLMIRKDFVWTAECAKDWKNRPCDWPESRFAAKARARQQASVYLVFKKT